MIRTIKLQMDEFQFRQFKRAKVNREKELEHQMSWTDFFVFLLRK